MICDDVRWVWLRGMGYAHTTAEQPCHDIYMMNEHDLCMLHDGSVMGARHAGGEEGLGGPHEFAAAIRREEGVSVTFAEVVG